MMESSLSTCVAILIVVFITLSFSRRSSKHIKHVPGPPNLSWVYGHTRELLLSTDYGDHEFQWQTLYGPVYKVNGCFGQERLIISDPTTLKFILHDTATFARSTQQQHIVRALIGEKSLLYVQGREHARLRNIMNPAFATANIRALPPLFKKVADRLIDQCESKLAEYGPDRPIDIFHSLHDATLDAIGEAAMGYSFYSNLGDSEYARSHHDLVSHSSVRSKAAILADALLPYIPSVLMRAVLYLPTPSFRALRTNRRLSTQVSQDLMDAKAEALKLELEPEKDLLSILVKANTSHHGDVKMSRLELAQQIPSVVIAGQGATGNTIAWALYELAKSPAYQNILRTEISERNPMGNELTYADLEELPNLNAFLKETLRIYAGLPLSERVATRDTVLPLSQPITTTTGKRITELPIKKGQFLLAAISSYNRLSSIWGPDAHEFKPSRWLEGNPSQGHAVGPYANLLTFFGGPRVCIGWRFAITEMQVILTELIRRFTFALPDDTIIRCNVALTVIPVTFAGAEPSLPLLIRRIE